MRRPTIATPASMSANHIVEEDDVGPFFEDLLELIEVSTSISI